MTQDELKALIEDLRLNHEYCPKEIILQAADELERLAQRTWVGLTEEERMTQDEIIEMAIEAEFVSRGKPSDEESELFVCVDKDIYKFAKLVASKEREACALICERVFKRMCPEAQENEVGIEAEIIRARGKV